MRLKAESILEFGVADEHQNAIVRKYRDEYQTLSELLDKQPNWTAPSVAPASVTKALCCQVLLVLT